MSSNHPYNRTNLAGWHERVLAMRSRDHRHAFERLTAEEQAKLAVLSRAMPETSAPRADADTEARAKGIVEHVTRRREAPVPPQHAQPRRTIPYDYAFTEILPAGAPVEWYGPNAATGTIGARLVSQAAGDRYATSSVGIAFYSSEDVEMRVFNNVNSRFFYDAGGIGLCSASARGALQISVFEEDVAEAIARRQRELFRGEAYMPLPGVPTYVSGQSEWTDNSMSLAFQARAGKWYNVSSEAVQYVRTSGPCGAQSDLGVIISSLRVVPRNGDPI